MEKLVWFPGSLDLGIPLGRDLAWRGARGAVTALLGLNIEAGICKGSTNQN